MLIDTHCHLNMMVKDTFDIPLQSSDFILAKKIAQEAFKEGVELIINAGTSLTESINCIQLAQKNKGIYATVGIHPNDSKSGWQKDITKIEHFIKAKKEHKIVAIGECGLDFYHPGYNVQMQKDIFKAQIELSLQYNLALTIHMRDATDEMVSCLDAFKNEKIKGVMHCFSGDQTFADYILELGLLLGIGGTITYPKNEKLRIIISNTSLKKLLLETDAPYLPPQIIRGKQNHPKYIKDLAQYIAHLKKQSFEHVAEQTSNNAINLFDLDKMS